MTGSSAQGLRLVWRLQGRKHPTFIHCWQDPVPCSLSKLGATCTPHVQVYSYFQSSVSSSATSQRKCSANLTGFCSHNINIVGMTSHHIHGFWTLGWGSLEIVPTRPAYIYLLLGTLLKATAHPHSLPNQEIIICSLLSPRQA